MARTSARTLTEREAETMNVLWERRWATAEQIREGLTAGLHDSTVRTLLRVLEAKGYVRHTVRGKSYLYEAVVPRPKAQDRAVTTLLRQFFGGSAEALLLRLVEDERITEDQLTELRERASRRKNEGRGR